MIEPGNQTDALIMALHSLKDSLYLLFLVYKPYFKALALIVSMYITYRIGHLTSNDPALSKVKALRNIIDNKIYINYTLPKRLKLISKLIKITLILILFYLSILTYLWIQSKLNIVMLYPLFTIFVCLVIFLLIRMIYRIQILRNNKVDKQINEITEQIIKILGQKVNSLIKVRLCRQKMLRLTKKDSTKCCKQDCQQLRRLYRQRCMAIMQLADNTISFRWCSLCKNRQQYDKILPYEQKPFNNKFENEQQINYRIKYLIDGINRMIQYIKDINPCNCSKLYWIQVNQQINKCIKVKNKIEKNIQLLEKCNKINIGFVKLDDNNVLQSTKKRLYTTNFFKPK